MFLYESLPEAKTVIHIVKPKTLFTKKLYAYVFSGDITWG